MVITKRVELPEPIKINTTTVAILKLFLSNPTKEYTIRELSQTTDINYRLVYEQVIKFEKEEIISIKRVGKSKLCKINLLHHTGLYAFIEDLRAREFMKRTPKLRVIRNALAHTKTKFYTAVLFGSYARGEQTQRSDIDLLFIVPQTDSIELIKNDVERSLKLLSYNIDINVIGETDFMELKNETTINIRNQVINNHIILFGAENYYRATP